MKDSTVLMVHQALRKKLENEEWGDVYDHIEVRDAFTIHSFMAQKIAIVTRKSDGQKGSLEFTHHPRFYFNFIEDN